MWSAFWKANILKVELSMIKIGVLLRKLWSLRSCFNILPPGALTPQGIEGAMKRDVSKHWCTLQWCASRGWFIAHENWTSCHIENIFLAMTWYLCHTIHSQVSMMVTDGLKLIRNQDICEHREHVAWSIFIRGGQLMTYYDILLYSSVLYITPTCTSSM